MAAAGGVTGQMTPAPFTADGCHGFSYLSQDIRSRLTRLAMGTQGDDPVAGRSRQIIPGLGGMRGGGMG